MSVSLHHSLQLTLDLDAKHRLGNFFLVWFEIDGEHIKRTEHKATQRAKDDQ